MTDQVTAFLPCRKGSQRIPDKNTKPFSRYPGGLLELKLTQLFRCKNIKEVILSTNDERVIRVGEDIASKFAYKELVIDIRPDSLSSSSASTDDVIKYVSQKLDFEHILWTHVTSPFLTSHDYDKCIEQYAKACSIGYDSLMTVQSHQSFYWNENEPINYDRNVEKWPRTQTIKKIYEVDSGAFIASKKMYLACGDRIGNKPYLLDLKKKYNIDIDWPEQFELAEILFNRHDV